MILKLDDFRNIVPTGFLGLLLQFGLVIGFFSVIKSLFDKRQEYIIYSPFQKLMVLISSLAVGCSSLREINDSLRPYPAVSYLLGLKEFPDQSLLNRFLNSFGSFECRNLNFILEELNRRFGLTSQRELFSLDYDGSGLVVYGNTYEGAKKGYFVNKRGQRGYRLSLVTAEVNGYREILYTQLDPGNIRSSGRFFDGIYSAAEVLGGLDRIPMIRADALLGSFSNLKELNALGIPLLIKGYDSRTAKNLARELSPDDWQYFRPGTKISELKSHKFSSLNQPVRVLLIKDRNNKKFKENYNHIYTTLSEERLDTPGILQAYNKRQTIEALIKEDKKGLNIDHLPTTSYWGIKGFLYLAAITHNLITLFRYHVLRHTNLKGLKTRELVERLMHIPAKIIPQDGKLVLKFPRNHRLVRSFFEV